VAILSSPTLERLILEARTFLRQPNKDNSTWSDEELTLYINDAIRIYFLEVNERAEGQFDATDTLDTVSGVETVALPTDCFEVRSLYKLVNNEYKILPYINSINESYSTQGGSSSNTYLPSYFFRGNNLVLRDVPNFSEVDGLKIDYTAFPETLIWGGDVLSNRISPVFKELIIVYAIYKCKLADSVMNGDANGHKIVEGHLADLYNKFKETIGNRSKYPQYIRPFNP
jgi:hypothetical protein